MQTIMFSSGEKGKYGYQVFEWEVATLEELYQKFRQEYPGRWLNEEQAKRAGIPYPVIHIFSEEEKALHIEEYVERIREIGWNGFSKGEKRQLNAAGLGRKW
jgi:hypothetical protein